MIALEILSSKKNKNETMWILIKILIISLIIRNTAYFISPYPVGWTMGTCGLYKRYL